VELVFLSGRLANIDVNLYEIKGLTTISSSWLADACGGVIFSPSSWEPQEEGMMNIAVRFSLSKKPRFIDPKGNKPND
jgi:hypothetical protein